MNRITASTTVRANFAPGGSTIEMNDQLRKDSFSNQGGGSAAKDVAMDLGRAADTIDAQREPIANALNRTASAIHREVDVAATALHRTADKLEATAQYVRETDLEAMLTKAQRLAKRYPGVSLAAGVALGLVVAKLLRSRD
jgi:hypothetical protein